MSKVIVLFVYCLLLLSVKSKIFLTVEDKPIYHIDK